MASNHDNIAINMEHLGSIARSAELDAHPTQYVLSQPNDW
jgi:hypothetical protein